MANKTLHPETIEKIHFDTLLAAAEETIAVFSANTWSDRAEHDPGMTLLQALAYGVSDAAYRHVLPLRDLLTPEHQGEQRSIFPVSFGPQQALTSSPITPDDYRRALLDLHGTDEAGGVDAFFFRNVMLISEPEGERYSYWYDAVTRRFSFQQVQTAVAAKRSKAARPGTAMATAGGDASVEVRVRGGYILQLELNRGVTRDAAQSVLNDFLRDNRNLCEAVRKVVWLEPQDINVLIDVELEDDCRTPANVMAQIYSAVESHLRPQVKRTSAAELEAGGVPNDEIYQGPMLHHGWIGSLPAPPDYANATELNLSPLANMIKAIAGVKSISKMVFESSGNWTMQLPAGQYPRPWGAEPFKVLASAVLADQKVRLFKRGQQLVPSESEIGNALPVDALINELPVTLPYGRWRNPAFYRNAGSRLPACYELEQAEPDAQQTQWRQFLLPLEQQLANCCHLLSSLPEVLSFDRRAPGESRQDDQNESVPVWGGQWPFQRDAIVDECANASHKEYRPELEVLLRQQRRDPQKELEIIGYLLGYFGVKRSPHTLLDVADADYLAVQRAYLQQIAELAYDRASIRIDRVSSLQKRIAARIGLAPTLVDGSSVDLGKLPFYLVEHRALMPPTPNPAYDVDQLPVAAEIDNAEAPACLWLTLAEGVQLEIGQAIDLEIKQAASSKSTVAQNASGGEVFAGLMIGSLDGRKVGLRLRDNARLGANLQRIIQAQGAKTLRWRNAQFWLEDMQYPLEYASDQTGGGDDAAPLPPTSKRLSSFSFPAGLQAGDEIALDYSPVLRRQKTTGSQTNADALKKATVVSIDTVNGSLVAQLPAEGAWPAADKQEGYFWYWAEPVADRFSFRISVAADRRLLVNAVEPSVTAAWIEQAIREEMPCHVTADIHWLADSYFNDFASTYQRWQNDGRPLGDDSYRLMTLLSIGERTRLANGIGAMRIATQAQKDQAVGADEKSWDADYIAAQELLHVPKAAAG